jgi:hypothetical protein
MNSFPAHGNVLVHINPVEGVSSGSGVFATVTETHEDPPGSGRFGVPFIGNCRNIRVQNIAPHDDGSIQMIILVDWPNDIMIGIQFLVVNDYN